MPTLAGIAFALLSFPYRQIVTLQCRFCSHPIIYLPLPWFRPFFTDSVFQYSIFFECQPFFLIYHITTNTFSSIYLSLYILYKSPFYKTLTRPTDTIMVSPHTHTLRILNFIFCKHILLLWFYVVTCSLLIPKRWFPFNSRKDLISNFCSFFAAVFTFHPVQYVSPSTLFYFSLWCCFLFLLTFLQLLPSLTIHRGGLSFKLYYHLGHRLLLLLHQKVIRPTFALPHSLWCFTPLTDNYTLLLILDTLTPF